MEPEKSKPSFSNLVLGYAVSRTRQALASKTRDAVWALPLAILGFGSYFVRFGWPAVSHQFVDAFYTTIAPVLIAVVSVFLWHLWLAPAALLYEAAGDARRSDPLTRSAIALALKGSSVNWTPYRLKEKYGVWEFASILAKTDPRLDIAQNEVTAFYELLIEQMKAKGLEYAPTKSGSIDSVLPSALIRRDAAIAWAIKNNIDVSHIK